MEVDGIELKIGNIQELQIRFLETMYELWPIAIERFPLLQSGEHAKIVELNKQEEPIIEKAAMYMKGVLIIRKYLCDAYNTNEQFRNMVNERAKTDVVWWTNCFVWTYDPRLTNMRTPKNQIPAKIPMVLYKSQEKVLTEIEFCVKNRIPFLVEKSRAEGLTELCCTYAVHAWLFKDGFKTTFGSHLEYEVDKLGQPDTIFARLRRIIYNLPKPMRPKGFESQSNSFDNRLLIVNPDNNNTIVGQGGDNVGRGGRSSLVVIDEKAFVEHPEAIDDAAGANTDCQGDVSTPNGMNAFYHKRMSKKVHVITVWWYQNPSKNPDWRSGKRPEYSAWYHYLELTKTEVWIAQNVDINYQASVEGVFVKPEWVKAAIDLPLKAVSGSGRVAGFDIGATSNKTSVYIMREGPVVSMPYTIQYRTPLESIWAALDRAIDDKVSVLNYDRQTVGEDLLPAAQTGDRKITFRLNGIYGQSRASDKYIVGEGVAAHEKYRNRRGEIWAEMAKRFERTYEHVTGIKFYSSDMLVSIPNDPILINELCAPLKVFTSSGKIGVESKEEMRARKVPSPNVADALAYCLADYDGEGFVFDEYDYTDTESGNCKDIVIDYENGGTWQYVSMVQMQNLDLYLLYCIWNPGELPPVLQVYAEFKEHNPNPKEIRDLVYSLVNPVRMPVKEWIGNDDMFKDYDKTRLAPYHLFRKEKIKLTQNWDNDWNGSIMLANEMFKNDMIEINKTCDITMDQVRHWSSVKGKPDESFGFALCLCQLVSRLKTKGEMTQKKVKKRSIYRGGNRFRGGQIDHKQESALKQFLKMANEKVALYG